MSSWLEGLGKANFALNKHQMIGQPVNESQGTTEQKLPFPELNKQLATSYVDSISGFLDRQGGQTPPGGGGASDFQGYFENVGGPPQSFTDVPIGGVYSPGQIQQGVNAIYADNDARSATQSRDINQQLRPGFGQNSPLLAELQANNTGRFQAMAGDQARQFDQTAAEMNAKQGLASRGLQLNVETNRAMADQNRRGLALGARGQDLTFQNALMQALLGAGGVGGLLGPLNYSQQSSSTHPYGYAAGESYNQRGSWGG